MTDTRRTPPTGVTFAVILFAAVTVAVMGVLVFFGKDTAAFVNFVVLIIPMTLGLVVVSKGVDNLSDKTDAQTRDLKQVKEQTNGKLANEFIRLHNRLDEIGGKNNGN